MEAGRIRDSGATREIVREYLTSGMSSTVSGWTSVEAGPLTVRDVRVMSADGATGAAFMRDEPLRIQVEFELTEHVPALDVSFYITTYTGIRIFDESLSDEGPTRLEPGLLCVELSVPPVLNVGEYSLGVWIGTLTEDFVHEPAALTFTLSGNSEDRPDRLLALRLPFAVHRLSVTP
jgi:ABC-2 type transport system ATP-binding protein/lipopolysaccharide transport system ATP-binding protein